MQQSKPGKNHLNTNYSGLPLTCSCRDADLCIIILNKEMKTDYNNLPERIDYLISEIAGIKELLTQRIRNPEEIPKYLDINQALLYLGKLGFLISRSKLYKLTSGNNIPCHKSDNRIYFFPQELDSWLSSQIEKKSETSQNFSDQSKQFIIKTAQYKNRK